MSGQVERTECEVAEGTDSRMEVLSALAISNGCRGWAFVQVDLQGDGFELKVEAGGATRDVGTIRVLLERTLEAL